MAKTGRPPKGDRRKISVGLDAGLYREIKVHCAINDLEMSDLLAGALAAWWNGNPARKAVQECITLEAPEQAATPKKKEKMA